MEHEEDSMKEARAAYRISDQGAILKGVQYLVDESGERTAVVLSLKEWGELWEDFHGMLVSESRKDEPTIPWETLRAELADEEAASGGV